MVKRPALSPRSDALDRSVVPPGQDARQVPGGERKSIRPYVWTTLALTGSVVALAGLADLLPEGLIDDLVKILAGTLGMVLCAVAFIGAAVLLSRAQSDRKGPAPVPREAAAPPVPAQPVAVRPATPTATRRSPR